MIQDKGSPWAGHHYVFIRDTLPHLGLLLFMGLGLMGKHIKGIGFRILRGEIGLRNNGDFWGKVFSGSWFEETGIYGLGQSVLKEFGLGFYGIFWAEK